MDTSNNLDIDYILIKDFDFWKDLETKCTASCCGIKAFDLSKEKINDIKQYYDYENTLQNIEEIIISIKLLEIKHINSSIFNLKENQVLFIQRLETIKKYLKGGV